MDLIKIAEQSFANENQVEHPSFVPGDTISVHYKSLKETKKESRFSGELFSRSKEQPETKLLR